MPSSVPYHVFRGSWFLGGPIISFLMCLGVAVVGGKTDPFEGFTEHRNLLMDSLMLFFSLTVLLGLFALIGTSHGWIRTSGRVVLMVVAPVLLAIHWNFSWPFSDPTDPLDASYFTGLMVSWAAAVMLWEYTCLLGRQQATRLSG